MDARSGVGPAFLTKSEVARLLGVPERTLEGWRLATSGPLWMRLGRHVRYDRTTCSPGRGTSAVARPRIAAGELGQVKVTLLVGGSGGREPGCATTRALVQLSADGSTADAARFAGVSDHQAGRTEQSSKLRSDGYPTGSGERLRQRAGAVDERCVPQIEELDALRARWQIISSSLPKHDVGPERSVERPPSDAGPATVATSSLTEGCCGARLCERSIPDDDLCWTHSLLEEIVSVIEIEYRK